VHVDAFQYIKRGIIDLVSFADLLKFNHGFKNNDIITDKVYRLYVKSCVCGVKQISTFSIPLHQFYDCQVFLAARAACAGLRFASVFSAEKSRKELNPLQAWRSGSQ